MIRQHFVLVSLLSSAFKIPRELQFGALESRRDQEERDIGSNLLRLSFLFKSCGLWTLSCDFDPHKYETLKSVALITAQLNAGVILVVTV